VIPAKFDYVRARTVDEAFSGLADPEARVIAGGHSLLPMMKLRLAFPSVLVDIAGLDWRGVEEQPGHIRVGALTSYDDLVRSPIVGRLGCLSDGAARVGDVQIRNAGTIGGGLAHADPASDITAATIALEAQLVLTSARGSRQVAAADFFTGPFTTGLEHDELLSEVRFPKPEQGEASAYESVEDPASGYPIAGAAIRVQVADGGGIRCTMGITGAAGHPFRPVEVEQLVRQQSGVPSIAEVREALGAVQTVGDVVADAEYRRHLAAVVLCRATATALRRVEQGVE
jgi:carbon-monoxide dehydrogenase medium subunit